MLKVNSKDTRTTPVALASLYFTRCSSVSIVNFEQVNAGWVVIMGLSETTTLPKCSNE